MADTRIVLAGLWTAVMLIYLLGDVLRIFSGSFVAGEIEGKKMTQALWLMVAVLMVIPIIALVLTVTLDQPASRLVNIVVAGFFFLFNLVGLPTYPQAFDRFLLAVSMVFNLFTIWYAWNWVG